MQQTQYTELNFYTEDLANQVLVQTIKVNQMFGIIGGCIIFLFFGIGCIPRSYNQFKMRYLVGEKLYVIMGQKRVIKPKHVGGKLVHAKNYGEVVKMS